MKTPRKSSNYTSSTNSKSEWWKEKKYASGHRWNLLLIWNEMKERRGFVTSCKFFSFTICILHAKNQTLVVSRLVVWELREQISEREREGFTKLAGCIRWRLCYPPPFNALEGQAKGFDFTIFAVCVYMWEYVPRAFGVYRIPEPAEGVLFQRMGVALKKRASTREQDTNQSKMKSISKKCVINLWKGFWDVFWSAIVVVVVVVFAVTWDDDEGGSHDFVLKASFRDALPPLAWKKSDDEVFLKTTRW